GRDGWSMAAGSAISCRSAGDVPGRWCCVTSEAGACGQPNLVDADLGQERAALPAAVRVGPAENAFARVVRHGVRRTAPASLLETAAGRDAPGAGRAARFWRLRERDL